MQAIFMVGEQRSGSNLVRLILNESVEIAGPHPPHILQRMMPLLRAYGNLEIEDNFSHLINDVCRLIELNPVPWEGIILNRQNIRSRCKRNSLIAIYGAVMDIYAESQSAKAWVCKSMQNIRWANELNSYFDKPKYIYLYRDPRDVTLSFMKAVIGDKHPYFIAKQWVQLQELCLEQIENNQFKQFFLVCYEDLITQTESVIQKLCHFLNIDFNQNMLTFHSSNEASRTAVSSQLWNNLTRPIMENNSKKFMQELSDYDIRIIESISGNVMDALGYDRLLVNPGEELKFSEHDIAEFTALNTKKIQAMEQLTDPDDIKRRELQSQVINEIRVLAGL